MDAMRTSETAHQTPVLDRARSDVRRLLKDMGVNTRADAGAVLDVAAALVKLREMWGDVPVEQLRPYAESARELARLETESSRNAFSADTETLLHTVVLGTILFEPVWLALRRVMHEDFAKTTLGPRRRKRAPKR
jgi:hypothetical protein